MPFHSDIEKWSKVKPDYKAVTIHDQSLSFCELISYRNAMLCSLVAKDIKQNSKLSDGHLIAVIAANEIEFITHFLAATFAQNTCLLLSSSLLSQQLRRVLSEINPDAVFCTRRFGALLSEYELLVLSAQDITDHQTEFETTQQDNDESPFLIGLTSGTTSQPKAFIRNRNSWRLSFKKSREVFNVNRCTTTLSPGPLAHGLSLYAMMETLSAGAHFITLNKFDVDEVIRLSDLHNVQRLVAVPAMLFALCNRLDAMEAKLEMITSIVTAGAKLENSLLSRLQIVLPNALISEYYGASELGFVTYAHRTGDVDASDVGIAFPDVDLEIRDADNSSLSVGQVGRVFVKSELVCDGYVSGSDGVGYSIEDGWATVGDMGYLDGEQRLHLAGRENAMVISGGNNIYPASVEQTLLILDVIEQVSVFGIEDLHFGSKLVAIVYGSNLDVSFADLVRHCSGQLPVYALPKEIYLAKSLPLTESGKISTKVLKDWLENNDARLRKL